jgi:hypothetical protein
MGTGEDGGGDGDEDEGAHDREAPRSRVLASVQSGARAKQPEALRDGSLQKRAERLRAGHPNASMPVMAFPSTSVCTSCVPS